MAWYKDAFDFVKEVGQEVSDDDVPSMSGAIAYFAVLSLPPLLAIVVWLAGIFIPDHVIEGLITGEVGDVLGEDTAAQLGTMLQQAQDVDGGSPFMQALGIGALVIGATGAFAQMQRALNRAWDIAPDPERSGIKVTVMKRLTSFGMILVIAFLMGVSLVLSAALSAFSAQLGELIGGAGWVLIQVADIVLPLAVFTLLFAAMFKVLPDANVPWSVTWVGAALTAVLFVVGKFAISFFIAQTEPDAAFGAAGSLVVLLIWVYYSALLLLVGAEFTQVWARRRGTRITPDEGSVRIVSDVRVERGEAQAGDSADAGGSDEDREEAESDIGGRADAREREGRHTYVESRRPQPRSGIYDEPDAE